MTQKHIRTLMPEGKKFNFLHTNPLTPYRILPR